MGGEWSGTIRTGETARMRGMSPVVLRTVMHTAEEESGALN